MATLINDQLVMDDEERGFAKRLGSGATVIISRGLRYGEMAVEIPELGRCGCRVSRVGFDPAFAFQQLNSWVAEKRATDNGGR